MIEKNYESREALKEAVTASIEKEENHANSLFFGHGSYDADVVKSIKEHKVKKLIKYFEKGNNIYLSYGNRIDFDNSYSTFNKRLIYLVQGEEVPLLDLYEWTVDEVRTVRDSLSYNDVNAVVILYSYFVRKNLLEDAENIFKKFVDVRHSGITQYYTNDDYTIAIDSSISNEYIPMFNYYENRNDKTITKLAITGYMKAIYNNNTYLPNDFNRDFYSKFYKKYRDIIKTVDTSSFFNEDGRMRKKENAPMINNFDLIESDPVAKDRVFRVFNYEFSKILKDMLKKDPEKTQRIMYGYLNTTHYKGKKKRQFLSTYSRLKDILDEEGLKLDPFKLNEDLQSHIVLDMLN